MNPCPYASDLVYGTSIRRNLSALYLGFLDDIEDFYLTDLVLQETYKYIGFALITELRFNLSFDKNVLKNLGHWLGKQTIARSIPIPIANFTFMRHIVATVFNSCSSQHLLITVHFAAWLLLGGSHSELFQLSHPWIT